MTEFNLNLTQASQIIKAGGIIAYPTETFYGLACSPNNRKALERLFKVKGRDKNKPISLIISSFSEVSKWACDYDHQGLSLMKNFWPGALTLVLKATSRTSPILTAHSGKIGLRYSSSKLATKLAQLSGGAITATSANLSGREVCYTSGQVKHQLKNKIDGIISSPCLKKSLGSTIVDASLDVIQILRQGEIPESEILHYLKISERNI